jgi:hypothetical protein
VPCGVTLGKLIVEIDDNVQYEASMPSFFMQTMQSEGLGMNTLTIRRDETQALPIDPQMLSCITQAIEQAGSAGVGVELGLYPLHTRVAWSGRTRARPTKRAPIGSYGFGSRATRTSAS